MNIPFNKPYMTGKMGVVVFNKKAFSPNSTYANFNPQGEFGVQFRLNDRLELRLVPLEYFHASNGYLAANALLIRGGRWGAAEMARARLTDPPVRS